jgi:hypothetical protein
MNETPNSHEQDQSVDAFKHALLWFALLGLTLAALSLLAPHVEAVIQFVLSLVVAGVVSRVVGRLAGWSAEKLPPFPL